MFRNLRLHEQGRGARADAAGQPVHHHLPDMVFQSVRLAVVGRQRMPVGHEKEAFLAVLEFHPVLDDAVVVAQMQPPGRAHAGHHPLTGGYVAFH